jgi:hypothetical protein
MTTPEPEPEDRPVPYALTARAEAELAAGPDASPAAQALAASWAEIWCPPADSGVHALHSHMREPEPLPEPEPEAEL